MGEIYPKELSLSAQQVEDQLSFFDDENSSDRFMFYAARSASPTWASEDVSGFLGLGAYITMFRNYKKYNFMYQLKANNKIEHMIVSFPRNLESIEFGGWNKSEDTEEL